MLKKKPYSQLALAIDLTSKEFKTRNPVILAEKIQEIFDLEYTVHQIGDYLSINDEDYERESNRVTYYSVHNN